MEKKKPPVRVRVIVCLDCRTRSLINPKPTEMEHVVTDEAVGLPDHLIGTFRCPKCGKSVGFVYEPVKIMGNGEVVSRGIDDYRLKK